MAWYLFILIFPLLVGTKRFYFKNESIYDFAYRFSPLIFFLLAFFLCGGYMTGSDWRSYELDYYAANWDKIAVYPEEKLFYLLMLVCKLIIPDFFIFLIICKFVVFYILYSFLKKYSPNIFYSYFFFIPIFGHYLFIDNPLRFMLALGFIVLSYRYLINKKFLEFLLLASVAFLFHYSTIIFIPFYFFRKIRISRTWLIVLFIACYFAFSAQALLILVNAISTLFPVIGTKYVAYITGLSNTERLITLGSLINIAFFFWFVFNDKLIKKLPHGELFYLFAIIYLFFTKIGVLLPSGFRFTYLFGPFFIVIVTYLFQFYSQGFKRLFSWGIAAYIILLTIKKVDNHFVYIPYTNYFVHAIKGDMPDYKERVRYNLDMYKKRKGKEYKFVNEDVGNK